MVIDGDFVDELGRCDFFAGNKERFYRGMGENTSFLICGAHKEPAPLVSVIITTYKRPQWLKVALESALEQEGFDDYEIIVVDNEGENTEIETETSRLVRSYHDKKIVYYRNYPAVRRKFDYAVSLSRSKWFCIAHDDDFLAKDHLRLMTDIVRERPDIGYLACTHRAFDDKDEAICRVQSRENVRASHSIAFYPDKSACVGCSPGWLGALIDRETFINMGGMATSISCGISDFIMSMKYMNRYNTVYCASGDNPLYFYRISSAQTSAGGSEQWLRFSISEYMFYKYTAKKYHPRFTSFWIYIASIIIHDKIRDLERRNVWCGGASIDTATLEQLTGLPVRNGRGLRRWVGKRLLRFIRRHYITLENTRKMKRQHRHPLGS